MRRRRSAAGRSRIVVDANGSASFVAPSVRRKAAHSRNRSSNSSSDTRASPCAVRPARHVSGSASSRIRCAGTPRRRGGPGLAQRCRDRDRARAGRKRRREVGAPGGQRLVPSRAESSARIVGIDHRHALAVHHAGGEGRLPRSRRPGDHHERAWRVAQDRRPVAAAQPGHAGRSEHATAGAVAARPGHAAQQLAGRDLLGAERHGGGAAVRREVVVVALEPGAPQSEAPGERVQLVERSVSRHVAPRA